MLFSSAIIRRHFYEIFAKFHLILAVSIVTAIWVHTPPSKLLAPPRVYLLVAASLWAALRTLRLLQAVYRNLRYGRGLSRATVHPVPGAVQVHVRVARPWRFRAGQYVYLCVPSVSHSAFLQSHPFAICWWYRDGDGNDVAVCIIQARRGFTRELGKYAISGGIGTQAEMRAIVEGPYGREICLNSYGTVLLFASGIGIAGQLPYVRQLLDEYHSCETKSRRIALFCEMDAEGEWTTPRKMNGCSRLQKFI